MTRTEWESSDDPETMLRWLFRDETEDVPELLPPDLDRRLRRLAGAFFEAARGIAYDVAYSDEFDQILDGAPTPAHALGFYLAAVPAARARQAALVREVFTPFSDRN
jgi:hypothetical protein